MRESILGKLKGLLKKGKKPPKDIEKKIKSDPELKAAWDDFEKKAAKAEKSMDDLLDLY